MLTEFVVGSHLALGVLLRILRLYSLYKSTFPNSNSTWIEDRHENQLRFMWLPLKILIVNVIVIETWKGGAST